MLARRLAIGLLILLSSMPATAEEGPDPAARIFAAQSRIEDFGADLRIELALSGPVQWRVHTLDAPRRLVVDLDGVDLSGAGLEAIVASDCVSGLRYTPAPQGGWRRIVLMLTLPLRIETAGLTVPGPGPDAALKLQLTPTTPEEFSRLAEMDPGMSVPPPARGLIPRMLPGSGP